jgi:CheY-like chemotaxis protein
MNVLIIDDDSEDTLLFCEALNELFPKAKCTSIHACKDILQAVVAITPDIIFLDGHMHPTSGSECLKLLNDVIDRRKTKIIIHSGSLSPAELSEFRQIGVDDILLKARTYEELKSNIVRIVVDKYQLASIR